MTAMSSLNLRRLPALLVAALLALTFLPPALSAVAPPALKAVKLKALPEGAKYLKLLQARFAERKWERAEQRAVLPQTRLDGVGVGEENKLTFSGACLAAFVPGWQETVNGAIRDLLRTDAEFAPLRDFSGTIDVAGVKPVRWTDRPTTILQKEVGGRNGLPGSLFWGSTYDAAGILHVRGFVTAEEGRKRAEEVMREMERTQPLSFRPTGSPRWTLEVAVTPSPVALKDLQAKLATATLPRRPDLPDPVLRSIRLDGFYYAFAPDKPGVLRGCFVGVCLAAEFKEEDNRNRAQDLLHDAIKPTWPAGTEVYTPNTSVEDIAVVSQPTSELQREVARHRTLDGVRVERGASFDAAGRLVLRGVWRDRGQEEELRKVVEGYYKGKPDRLDRDGLVFAFEVLRTDEVLQELRRWTADNLEDVWLQRLYFNGAGRLRLQGVYAHPADAAKVRAQLQKVLGAHPELKRRVSRGGRPAGRPGVALVALGPVASGGDEDDPLELTRRPQSLADQLRATVQFPENPKLRPPSPRWDGVVLRRCYYDPQGVYQLSGLIDNPRQRAALNGLLADFAQRETWREALERRWDLQEMKELPLGPMLARMRLIFPAYNTFDGLTLAGAAHDVGGRLVLRGFMVGPHLFPGERGAAQRQLLAAADLLRGQLNRTDNWRARADGGVRYQLMARPQAPDRGAGQALMLRAVSTLRIGLLEPRLACCPVPAGRGEAQAARVAASLRLLDTAALHIPADSTVRYLSAVCHYLRNEQVQAERDLRRMVGAEQETAQGGPARRVTRLRQTEALQGTARRAVATLQKRAERNILANEPPLELAEQEE
jgi:hypothetical protein